MSYISGITLSILLIAILTFILIVSTSYVVSNNVNGTPYLDTEEPLGLSTQQDCEGTTFENASLVIITSKSIYSINQLVEVTPELKDEGGCLVKDTVRIIVNKSGDIVERYSVGSNPDIPLAFSPHQSGIYEIEGFSTKSNSSATATVIARDLHETRWFFFLLLAVIAAVSLMIVIIIRIDNYALQEILRFSLTSGIVISVSLSFVFIEEEIGSTAPVGLVEDLIKDEGRSSSDELYSGQSYLERHWVINVGGIRGSTFDFVGGVQLPLYIVLFGIAGGYLRYLYEIARYGLVDRGLERLEKKRNEQLSKRVEALEKEKPDNGGLDEEISNLRRTTLLEIRDDKRRLVFHRSIEDLATLFLSPLLAIAMYFILVQWQPTQTSTPLLAVVSFGTGLVTNEIVELIIRIVKSVITSSQAPEQRSQTDDNKDVHKHG